MKAVNKEDWEHKAQITPENCRGDLGRRWVIEEGKRQDKSTDCEENVDTLRSFVKDGERGTINPKKVPI